MPLHAMAVHGANSFEIAISGDETDYVLLDNFDLPTDVPVTLGFLVVPTFTIDSSDAAIPALSFAGLHADSKIYLDTRLAFVRGAGGAGGDGGEIRYGDASDDGFAGGGGGGAGSAGGPGGAIFNSPAYDNETVGGDGSIATAGTGGNTDTAPATGTTYEMSVSGEDGGTAILTPCKLIIRNDGGFILAGGGGGAPGLYLRGEIAENGTDGGLEGQPGVDAGYPDPLPDAGGSPAPTNGAAGYAIRHTGVGPTWISGNGSPNVEGLIG